MSVELAIGVDEAQDKVVLEVKLAGANVTLDEDGQAKIHVRLYYTHEEAAEIALNMVKAAEASKRGSLVVAEKGDRRLVIPVGNTRLPSARRNA